ncbi:hypothetical protein PoB_005558200 [Plakobranchus ocellatus]|uniref:Uncharacterized protein n=1 Tax=Plakobranchus ocellatus TaxID=259542 RepID=A0AAV4CCL6_9GAST|nr:hypothetical protein PoB_005558200 [Plakobranchus ocellatus]
MNDYAWFSGHALDLGGKTRTCRLNTFRERRYGEDRRGSADPPPRAAEVMEPDYITLGNTRKHKHSSLHDLKLGSQLAALWHEPLDMNSGVLYAAA